jgi:hypothetical protein
VRNIIKIIFTPIILIAIFSCSQGYIVNTNAYTSYPEGRNLYMSKCGGCHQLFDPNNYTKGEWDRIMLAMQEKSKIDDQQKNDILDWIIETRKSLENVKLKNKI